MAYRAAQASGKVKFKPAARQTVEPYQRPLLPAAGTSSKKDRYVSRLTPAKDDDEAKPSAQKRRDSGPSQGQTTPSQPRTTPSQPQPRTIAAKPPGGLKSVQAVG